MVCVHVKPAQPSPSTAPPLPCETHPAQRPSITSVGKPDGKAPHSLTFLDNSGPVPIDLRESAYNKAFHAPCASWCLQTHVRTNPLQGVLPGLPPRVSCPLYVVHHHDSVIYASNTFTSSPATTISTPKTVTTKFYAFSRCLYHIN